MTSSSHPLPVFMATVVNIDIHQNLANPWNINICVEHTGCAPLNLRDVCARARAYLEAK